MPFDPGNNPPYLILRSGLIAKAGIMAPHMVRRAVNGVGQMASKYQSLAEIYRKRSSAWEHKS